MNARTRAAVLSSLMLAIPVAAQRPQELPRELLQTIRTAPWVSEEVALGVVCKQHRFEELFGAPQSVAVLEADLSRRTTRLRVAQAREGRVRSSALAVGGRAVAAVNGGFFNVGTGAPIGLVKIDGELLNPGAENTAPAFGIDRRERLIFRDVPAGDWAEARHALAAGPLLVRAGRFAVPTRKDRRHPRTAIGLTQRRRAILLTVDGRTPSSAGMTLAELARVMLALGCTEAINLDGGGSTAMWVRSGPVGGIVSFPCDNRKYDHRGERAVSNAVLILAPDVIVRDEEAAVLLPPEAWRTGLPEPAAYRGDHAAATGESASARFAFTVELGGEYSVAARFPHKGAQVLCTLDGQEVTLRVGDRQARWIPIGKARVADGGEVVLEMRPVAGTPLVVDAVRLEQRTEN